MQPTDIEARIKNIFETNGANRTTITSSPTVPITFSYDVKMSIYNDDSFFYIDETLSLLVLLDKYGKLINSTSVSRPFFFQPVSKEGGSIYITTRVNPQNMYRQKHGFTDPVESVKLNSTFVQQQYTVRYSNHTNLLYACDINTGFINAYDLYLNRDNSKSFNFRAAIGSSPLVMTTFQTKDLGLMYLVSGNDNVLYAFKSDWTLNYVIKTFCANNGAYELLIYGNIMVATCHQQQVVKLYTSDGNYFYDTGSYLIFNNLPLGLAIDSCGRLIVAVRDHIDIFTPSI